MGDGGNKEKERMCTIHIVILIVYGGGPWRGGGGDNKEKERM